MFVKEVILLSSLLLGSNVLGFQTHHNQQQKPQQNTNSQADGSSRSHAANLFEDFCFNYKKDYCSNNALAEERSLRFQIFQNNLEFIESHNAQSQSYKVGITPFADMTNEEFKELVIPRNPQWQQKSSNSSYQRLSRNGIAKSISLNDNDIPDSVDWRGQNVVTDVKNQKQCGSCYAFSATGAIEGAVALATGSLVPLSEQEIVDCEKVDFGCNGGLMDHVFSYAIRHKGLCTEEEYRYKALHGRCKANADFFHKDSCTHVSPISGYVDVKANDEEELLKAVAQQPVAVAIHAGDRGFQLYTSGIYDSYCGTQLNHGVLAVGYGTTADKKDYWLIKNSWSASWGDEGYIKLARNIDSPYGQCGIAMSASYPTA